MSGMTDLAYTAEETAARNTGMAVPLAADAPKYPYGLSISLENGTLEKLSVDISDWKVGDVIPLDILVKVTSISENETDSGRNCCVSLQITHMGAEEEGSQSEEYGDRDDLIPHGYHRIRN